MKKLAKQVRALSLLGGGLSVAGGLGCLLFLFGAANSDSLVHTSFIFVIIGIVSSSVAQVCSALLKRIAALEAQVKQ